MKLTTIFYRYVIYTLIIWNNLLTFTIGFGSFGHNQILQDCKEKINDDRIDTESNQSRTAHKCINTNNCEKICTQNDDIDSRYVS